MSKAEGARSGAKGEARATGLGKTFAQIQAEQLAQTRFTELMASGGVGYNQIAKEVLFFLPSGFLTAYEQLWYRGLAGKDDGGVGARGAATAEQARVGKASGKGLQGLGGAKRKTYKKYWVIADERSLELKDRIDKRLRSMAREMEEFLAGVEVGEARGGRAGGGSGGSGGSGGQRRALGCAGCGRMVAIGWRFCAGCGQPVGDAEIDARHRGD